MEKSYNELLGEMSKKAVQIKFAKKNQSLINLLKKKNDTLSSERNTLHKENLLMKKKILSCDNITCQNEENIKNKDLIIENLQKRNKNFIKLVKDKDNIIEEQSKTIKELNDIIKNKNEKLKIMMNISKEVNKENKINIKEFTKQAAKTMTTIKNNNNKNRNHSFDFNTQFNISNNKSSFEDFEKTFKNNKTYVSLAEALNEDIYIPNNLNEISKEFLVNMNFKNELIKNELFSGLIREANFVKYFQKIFEKISKNKKDTMNLFPNILKLKKKYLNVIKENYKLKTILLKVSKDNNEMQKLKEKINKKNKLIKNKFLEKQKELNHLKNEIKSLNIVLSNSNLNAIQNYKCINNNNTNNNFRHISLNNFKKRVKSIGEINPNQNWNTLPTLDHINSNEPNINNIDNSESKLIIANSPKIKEKRINKKICQRKTGKKKIIQNIYKLSGSEIINYNNSLEFNKPYKTETTLSTYFVNSKKTNKNNNNEIDKNKFINNSNFKKDISSLQTEINNIIIKSSLNNKNHNITDIKKEKSEKNKKPMFTKIKINNYINKKSNKHNREIITDRTHKKINSLSILSFQENNKSNNNINYCSQVFQSKEKEDFNKNKTMIESIKKYKMYTIFNYHFFFNLFLQINSNIFDSFELNKYRQIYNLSNINSIYLTFKQICNDLKNKTDEMNLKINKSHTLTECNFREKKTLKNEKKNIINKSFRIFNERIISLKKFEFEFINMNDYIKNYLVSQEITIKIMYNSGKKNIKFEPIEKLFNLFEDCLSYRINEMNENIIFNRKLLIKLFKIQINCLFLSFEYNYNL